LALSLLTMVSACSGGDKDSFRNVDHDRNGKISYEELLFVFPDVTPDLFARLDANKDGSLSEDEYKAFLKNEAPRLSGGKPAAAPAAQTPKSQKPAAQGGSVQPSTPYKGEEVIEIPAPGNDKGAKAKTEKGKRDAKEAKGKTEAAASEGTQYTVQHGDYLSRIAHKFGVSVEDIVRANGNMNPDTLRDGQTITIPPRP
jgi:LysM repeat protein